jgi:large subunit ribosomal protein L30
MALKIKVTQVRSAIHRAQDQKDTIRGLGLRRPNHSVVLEDSAAIRGMIRKVQHLVAIEPVE